MTPKKLPMIVDIGIDNSGKKMFQVHETSKQVRNGMPISSQFAESSFFDGTSSPDSKPRMRVSTSASAIETSSTSIPSFGPPRSDSADMSYSECITTPTSATSSTHGGDAEKDIWCHDVQQAFEEVLAIVPKKGLNKIKIGGRSCGRNELISDYIMAKTGKYRSRKQVSSHIQVIKNMGSRKELIALINDGPQFGSDEEAERNSKHFEEIFAKINLNKSLGVVPNGKSSGSERRHSTGLSSTPKRKRLNTELVSIKNISFSIESSVPGNNSFLTFQEDVPVKSLTLKEDANFASRFPGLEEFASTNVPILHNMIRLLNPANLPIDFSVDRDLKTNYMLDFATIPQAGLCSFTSVYSFGAEVLKVNEDNFMANTNQPFLLKFWKCFFYQLLQQPSSLDAAFKGITVKQVIYERHDGSFSLVPKTRIKAVLLWEFSKVETWREAVSSTSRLFLPPSLQTPIELSDALSQPPMLSGTNPIKQEYIFSPNQGMHPVKQEPQDPLMGLYQAPYFPQTPTNFHTPPPSGHTFHPSANVDLATVRSLPNEDSAQCFGSFMAPSSTEFGP
ncbi:hypothetical protein FT663_00888 [Candidozyma haemuli var. vulneris]|uniref:TEA domain-containing protein n=1 Tax=Candidozyma haemuli TaxID=45357 RepID=A0A2V1AVV9_9ASCO|nr:hypothetical protein CXQ85_004653 [[Candida] haemuloni]KAF3990952.1 hypothetical protein FT662_02009 [[Candida] haemuloni var. vulneris]KAF3995052.1 hypothetical protein FT663_00888 [[Candida] haemuloni var. vulneris]PVH21988.1 hypothetical protein CXQ85_004653 [[Candida] haemuloni]